MYSAICISNAFIEQAKSHSVKLSPLRLQVLLYLAQGAYHKRYGASLFDDFFINGPGGPAVPSIRAKVAAFEGLSITERINVQSATTDTLSYPCLPESDKDSLGLIRALLWKFRNLPDAEMLLLIAGRGSAWMSAEPGSVASSCDLLADADRVFDGLSAQEA